jgi:hypothetical protein
MKADADSAVRRLFVWTFLSILFTTASFAIEVRMGHVSAWILGLPAAAVIAAVVWFWTLRSRPRSTPAAPQLRRRQISKRGYWLGMVMPAVLTVAVMTALRMPVALTWLAGWAWFPIGLILHLRPNSRARRESPPNQRTP